MGKKILIVEDDMDASLYASTILEENGYTPIVASDGDKGLKMIKKEMPDLVILDIILPKKSGIKVYKEMKTDQAIEGIPVIILSAIFKKSFDRARVCLNKFESGCIPEPGAYLEKPFDPEELAGEIRRLIG